MNKLDPLERNNVTLAGNPQARRAMVFVHGFGTDQRAWSTVAESFGEDFSLVLLDNVGAGPSEPAAFQQSRYLNLGGYVSDLFEVCDALLLQDAILVGHSVGAMICLLAAARRPGRFSRLVMIGASPRYLDDEGYRGGFAEADLKALYQEVSLRYSEWADAFAPAAMGNADKPQLARHFAETMKSIPADRALTVLCSIFQSDHRADVSTLDIPTLVIQSQDDPAVPLEVAEYLHQHIKGSRLALINATGHLPHVSARYEVVAAMSEFIDGQAPSPKPMSTGLSGRRSN